MANLELGALSRLDLRTCWPDEARDLTPWLASEPGLKLLADSLGLQLALEGKEVSVGPYSADILARDLDSNSLVVVENQLEKTNHDHLGKILTYGAVLGAEALVWIARTFTDEHHRALEWLNELTRGDLRLYAVELQLWRIGDSLPAPRFEVLTAPSEIVRQAVEAKERTETQQLQLEFWNTVRPALELTGKFASLKTPRHQNWFEIALGRADIFMSLAADTWGKRISVRVYLKERIADYALSQLGAQREQIEAEIGDSLEWNPRPTNRDKVIELSREGDIAERDRWPEFANWLATKAAAFRDAMVPRISKFPLPSALSTLGNSTPVSPVASNS